MSGGRLQVGILGATGSVGQKLVALLEGHPDFELTVVAASARSAGSRYADAVHWLEPVPLPGRVAGLVVQPCTPPLDCELVFSALDADIAREVEPAFAAAGVAVISNASAHRLRPEVPLIVPEVNPGHLELLRRQSVGGGFIVTNPNCSTVGLVAVLKPIADRFGVRAVELTTLQAISGAGYPGVPALDILGNVLPNIAGEEEKLRREPRKILGRLGPAGVEEADIAISVQTTRVPVADGHLLSISVGLGRPASADEVREALRSYPNPIAALGLPSAPASFLAVHDDDFSPQPRLHAGLGGGMTVSVGRVRPCPVLDVRLVALVHNTVRGAAGAAILNAELLRHGGYL